MASPEDLNSKLPSAGGTVQLNADGSKAYPAVGNQEDASTGTGAQENTSSNSDYRARLQLYRKNSDTFFANETNVLTPLKANRGVVFPYTPNIFLSRSANYGSMDFKGANFPGLHIHEFITTYASFDCSIYSNHQGRSQIYVSGLEIF